MGFNCLKTEHMSQKAGHLHAKSIISSITLCYTRNEKLQKKKNQKTSQIKAVLAAHHS